MALAVLRGAETPAAQGPDAARFAATFGLTARQGEVLAFLARGYPNKTIAERLGIAEGTVEEHVAALFRKVGVDSRTALVAKYWLGPR